MFKRIIYAIQVGIWVFRHKQIMAQQMFTMLSSLLEMILKTATDGRPYMTRIEALVDYPNVKEPIVSIWFGAGINAEPIERIRELSAENAVLKEKIASGDKN